MWHIITQMLIQQTVIPSHIAPNYCLTNFLPDRCSTGPAIPGNGVPPIQGLPDYESPRAAGRLTLTGRSRNVDIALSLTGLPPTSRGHLSAPAIGLPDIPEPLSQHIHLQSRNPICVRAFTVLLLYVSRAFTVLLL